MHGLDLHHILVWVTVSAITQWLLGALWYGVVFRKSWRALVGLADGAKPKNAAFGMVTSFVACWLLSFILVHIINWAGATSFTGGMKLGVLCWVGFMAPALFAQHIFENRRANLFAINAGYWVLVMAMGGAIMGAFH